LLRQEFGMEGSRFDAWTRRRFGLTTGGTLATLFGLRRLDEAGAKHHHHHHKHKHKHKQKNKHKHHVNHPDIVLIYVDDMREQDFIAVPRTMALLGDQGATYPNYFITTPLCAPSRSSFFRGQYAHNHGVLNNTLGWSEFHSTGDDLNTIATWLGQANPKYHTAHVGKYVNGYKAAQNQIGPGWSDWIVPVPVSYYDYTLNVNGTSEEHGSKNADYLTDVLAEKARNVITTTPRDTPLFLYFAPKAPHGPATPANRHKGDFADAQLDEGGSFNEADMSDKPAYMQRPLLDQDEIDALEETNEMRLETLLAVDEAVEDIVSALDEAGRLDGAYILFVTDNGYLLGEHRRSGKNVPYEEAIRMSMLVRGPSIHAGSTHNAMVANIDLAPTIAELAGVKTPAFVDGRSFKKTFGGSGFERQALLIEMFPDAGEDTEEGDTLERALNQKEATSTRRGIRTEDWVYVEHGTGERELYDLHADPLELESLHDDPDHSDDIQRLSAWLATLQNCATADCRKAENGPPK
jgi:N-acetylglucosamine-6-sulfatase